VTRVTRGSIAIVVIGGAIVIGALGALAVKHRRFDDQMKPAISPALSDQPIEMPLPTVFGDHYWGVFPALGDVDGDGRPDLMVGTAMGRLRFFRNVGTAIQPRFAPPVWFDDLCPGGCIPTG
jgi:FG-GAP repeat